MNVPLTAGEICTRVVVFADRGMMLDEAARLLRSHHVGSLVVVDAVGPAQRVVAGMITDRDIATAVAPSATRTPPAWAT
jgi:CBS domain-containing protein